MIRKKLIYIVVVFLCFISFNVATLQDWDVPLIGPQKIEAGVPGCTFAFIYCLNVNRFRIEAGCRYLGGWQLITCQPCWAPCS